MNVAGYRFARACDVRSLMFRATSLKYGSIKLPPGNLKRFDSKTPAEWECEHVMITLFRGISAIFAAGAAIWSS